jgi:hypothetical protein
MALGERRQMLEDLIDDESGMPYCGVEPKSRQTELLQGF